MVSLTGVSLPPKRPANQPDASMKKGRELLYVPRPASSSSNVAETGVRRKQSSREQPCANAHSNTCRTVRFCAHAVSFFCLFSSNSYQLNSLLSLYLIPAEKSIPYCIFCRSFILCMFRSTCQAQGIFLWSIFHCCPLFKPANLRYNAISVRD